MQEYVTPSATAGGGHFREVDGGYDVFGGIHIHDIENEEWFESLSEEDLDAVGEISDSLLTEKERSDFNDAMNGDYTGFDSFLENNLIA